MQELQSVWLGTVGYRDGWRLQQRLAELRRGAAIPDCVLLLEHRPVYTMGRTGEMAHVKRGPDDLIARGADYVDVDRGGSVTFHGAGQLVAYPIVRIAEIFPIADQPGYGDVGVYLRALEETLIATVAGYGVAATQRPPYTGIWVGKQKLAAIGVKLARGITTHGIALNVTTDLSWFEHIVPCGIADAGVTSLEALGQPGQAVESVGERLAGELARRFDRRLVPAGTVILAALAPETVATT